VLLEHAVLFLEILDHVQLMTVDHLANIGRSRAAFSVFVRSCDIPHLRTPNGRKCSMFNWEDLRHFAALAIDRSARTVRPAVAGIVSISAPPALASSEIAPRLGRLRRDYRAASAFMSLRSTIP
jgi:hypothetical protein